MKTPQQYENSARNFSVGVIMVMAIVVFLLINKECKSQETAYLVTIEQPGENTRLLKTKNDSIVNQIINSSLGTSGFNIDKATSKSNVFDTRIGKKYIYVERRRVVYTRSGKLKFKKLRK